MKSRNLIKKKYLNKIKELKKHNLYYYDKSKPKISDSEYDKLKQDIINLEKKYIFLKNKNSPSLTIGVQPSKNFLKSNSLSSRDKKIILKVIESYEHLREKNFLKNDQFVLSDHEIHEFLKLEENNILRYILYRYKYNIYPKLNIYEDYPPNIQIEPTSICNLRCVMCYQADRSFSSKSKGFMGYMKLDLLKKVIDEIEGKIEAVTFASRGEPTLHPELDEFLKFWV